MIDGTGAVVVAHINHRAEGSGSSVWMAGGYKRSNWMVFLNNHLALSHGSYKNQDGTGLHTPWKLSICEEPLLQSMCLIKRKRPGTCPCEHSAFVDNSLNDPTIMKVPGASKEILRCGIVSRDSRDMFDIAVSTIPGIDPIFGLPFTLPDILSIVASNDKKLVILTGMPNP